MSLMNRRYLFAFLAIAAVTALVWLAFRPAPVMVETALVDTGHVEQLITEEGRTHVHERYVVSSPVTGYRPRLRWHVGDKMRQGELLVALQPSRSTALDPRSRAEAEAAVARAESALAAAQTNAESAAARVEFTEREYQRLKDLFDAGTISRQQLDAAEYEQRDARAHLRSAEFSIEVARHELEAAQTRLGVAGGEGGGEPIRIMAPTDGVVLAVPVESEGAVQVGQPLLEIGDPATLEVHVDLLTTDAVKLEPGTPVRIVRWGGDPVLEGEVRLIEPVAFTKVSALGVEEQRARVIIELLSPAEQWSSLGDGYRVEAEFIAWQADDTLRVPGSALFRRNDNWMVYVVEDGVARLRRVSVIERGETRAAVAEGLNAGDEVILYPAATISEGVRVERFAQ
ncbi:MAG: HlyD family efflux transporter periplasmic adaptor subunit [Gammaproteobacteria bacterium]|nr:HlyD family efflux transporter periplasmic adaptor subunit [Gammaproteobacteria bacterium]